MSAKQKDKILEIVRQPLADEGFDVVDVSLSRYRNQVTLRVYIYADGGTTLEQCARASSIVGDLVDGTDMFRSGYTLEVSSPGLDRPLKTAGDFRYRVGETVRIDSTEKGRKPVTAEIVEAGDSEVRFRNDSGEFTLPLSSIAQAKIVY